MAGFNKVIMIENLTWDPELTHLDSGAAASTLGLAVNRRYANQAGEQREEVCFIDVNVYGRLAEVCCQYPQHRETGGGGRKVDVPPVGDGDGRETLKTSDPGTESSVSRRADGQ